MYTSDNQNGTFRNSYDLILNSIKSPLQTLKVLAQVPGYDEDKAFSIISNLPATILSGVDLKMALEYGKLLEEAGAEVDMQKCSGSATTAPAPVFVSLSITSLTSPLAAIKALTSLGNSEDKAFELISNIPALIYDSVDEKTADSASNKLKEAGCTVEIHPVSNESSNIVASLVTESTSDDIESIRKDYEAYLRPNGNFNDFLTVKEFNTIKSCLEDAVSKGDIYAKALLSNIYSRESKYDKAFALAEQAAYSDDEKASLEGKYQLALQHNNGEESINLLKSIRYKGDAAFNEKIEFTIAVYNFLSADEPDVSAFVSATRNISDSELCENAKLLLAIYKFIFTGFDEDNGTARKEINEILAKVHGDYNHVADIFRLFLDVLITDDFERTRKSFDSTSEFMLGVVTPAFPFWDLAYYYLAEIYFYDENPYRNDKKGFELLSHATKSCNPEFLLKYSQMLIYGEACARNLNKAIKYLEKVVEKESSESEDYKRAQTYINEANALKYHHDSWCCITSLEYQPGDEKNSFVRMLLNLESLHSFSEDILIDIHPEDVDDASNKAYSFESIPLHNICKVEKEINGIYTYNGIIYDYYPEKYLNDYSDGIITLKIGINIFSIDLDKNSIETSVLKLQHINHLIKSSEYIIM